MSDDNNVKRIYVPSSPLPAARSGVLTGFDPGIRTLKAGFQIAPPFLPLPVDVVLEKDTAVTLRDGVTVYVDVFRPVPVEKRRCPSSWLTAHTAKARAPRRA